MYLTIWFQKGNQCFRFEPGAGGARYIRDFRPDWLKVDSRIRVAESRACRKSGFLKVAPAKEVFLATENVRFSWQVKCPVFGFCLSFK